MSDHPLERLGWRTELQQFIDDPALVAARMLAADRGRVAPPVTGDFVAMNPDGPVRKVLPRRGVIARRKEKG